MSNQADKFEDSVQQYADQMERITEQIDNFTVMTGKFEQLLQSIDQLQGSERTNSLRSTLQATGRKISELRKANDGLRTVLQDTAAKIINASS